MSQEECVRVAVFGHYGIRNLGDEAIVESVIGNLRSRGAKIVCVSLNPQDSRERYGVDAFPIRYRSDYFHPKAPDHRLTIESDGAASASARVKAVLKSLPLLGTGLRALGRARRTVQWLRWEVRFLRSARQRLADIDLLLVAGSNQLGDDFGASWGFPYTLLKWTLLAQSTGPRVAFVSVGAGPLDYRMSVRMLRLALKRADFISYRDEQSKALIESWIPVTGEVYPDLAHSLKAGPARVRGRSEQRLMVGVNPFALFDRRYHNAWADETKYADYVRKLAGFCAHLIGCGHRVVLFSTQFKDELVLDDIRDSTAAQLAREHRGDLAVAKSQEVQELMGVIGQCDIVVATRFHAAVLPLQLHKPVLGISYHPKTTSLLDAAGLHGSYVSMHSFEEQELVRKFEALVERYRRGDLELAAHTRRNQAQLDEQYRRILDLARPEPAVPHTPGQYV